MTEKEFIELFATELDTAVENLSISTELNSILEWDSLGRMVVTSWIQDTYESEVTIEEITKMKTIKDIMNVIKTN